MKNDGWSISTVIGAVVVLILALGWCVLACEYAKEIEDWKPAGGDLVRGRSSFAVAMLIAAASMVYQSVLELPNLFQVIQFSVMNRIGMVIGFFVLILIVVAGGIGAKSLEKHLESPYRR